MEPSFSNWMVNIDDLSPAVKKWLPYIGEPCIKESSDLFLNVENPDTRGFYVHRMEIYEKLLVGLLCYEEDEREIYTYFMMYWWTMIRNYDLDSGLMESRHNFDWLNWRIVNPVDETWEQCVTRHQVVNLVN